MAGGTRKVVDERILLTELGKLFHTVRATFKEQRQVNRAKRAAGKSTDTKQHRASDRKSKAGGSVWVLLKGGFASSSVPAAYDKARVERRALCRRELSERRRMKALEAAEGYVQSAWEEAANAGLLTEDQKLTDEGTVYLREQYNVAIKMLNAGSGTGCTLRRLVEVHCKGRDGLQAVVPAPLQSGNGLSTAAQREDMATRESAIRLRFHEAHSSLNSVMAEEALKSSGEESLYHMAEPQAVRSAAGPDIAATKCIVRIRNSGRLRHTGILSTPKAVNYFKSNIMQVLRKELSNSKMPRGLQEECEPKAAQTASGSQQPPHGSSKKNKKKR